MPERRLLTTTVRETTWLTPEMVRIVVEGEELEGFGAGEFTDHYVKCRFGDKMRSYTVRDWDSERRRLTLDFVVHGDRGDRGPVGGTRAGRGHAGDDGSRRRLHPGSGRRLAPDGRR